MRGQTWPSRTVARIPQEGRELSALCCPVGSLVPSARPAETLDIVTLLERVRMGSREAVDELFEEFREELLSLIRRRLGRGLRAYLEADDVLQITLLRAFEHVTEFRGTSRQSLHAWLARIARNAIRDQVDYLRRQRRDMCRTLPLDDVV